MANKFEITISAIDRATATVRKINKQIGQTFRPVAQIKNSAAALGRELGVVTLGKNLANMGRAAQTAGSKLAGVAAPLTAIVGGGTIAGIAALAEEWGKLGAETARTAQTLGISTDYLQSMRGAAAAAGLSSDAMTASLKSLGDTMQDAMYGRNQAALSMLGQLGVKIRHTKDGAIDTSRAFNDMSLAISRIKSPQVQSLVARTFGLEQVLPLLRQGPAAIAAYQKRVESLGGVMSGEAIASAEKFSLSLNYLKVATEGVRNSIGSKLMPILTPLVDKFTEWLGKNRELIASRVAEFVQGFATWLQQVDFGKVLDGITSFIRGVGKVVDFIGGWKVAAIGVAAIMAGPLVLSVLSVAGAIVKLGAGLSPVLGSVAALVVTFTAAYEIATKLYKAISTLNEQGDLAQDSWLAKLNDRLVGAPDNTPTQLHMSPRAIAYQQQLAANGGNSPAAPATTVYGTSAQQGVPAQQAVHVSVDFKNAPPGTVATTRTNGQGGAPVRVAHAMAGA